MTSSKIGQTTSCPVLSQAVSILTDLQIIMSMNHHTGKFTQQSK